MATLNANIEGLGRNIKKVLNTIKILGTKLIIRTLIFIESLQKMRVSRTDRRWDRHSYSWKNSQIVNYNVGKSTKKLETSN